MALILSDIKLPVTADESELTARISAQFGVDKNEIKQVRIVRRALDARKKSDIHFLLRVRAELTPAAEKRLSARFGDRATPVRAEERGGADNIFEGTEQAHGRIVIAGLGPAGLFAALSLAERGYRPLVLERGRAVEARVDDVARYRAGGALDPESNVLFGEGGAGTFSDGKLTSRSKDPRVERVIETLHRFGAPEDILVNAKPHVGTDRLRCVVSALRREIERLGGEVRFSARLSDLSIRDGALTRVEVSAGGGLAVAPERLDCAALVLAVGHSARDAYRMLHARGVQLAPKGIAVGVRIEHPQALIDRAQYGALAGHPRLGAAEYRLTARSGDRGVYTFCMCPGGEVIASVNAEEQAVTNGMSNFARDAENANAAVVVQVRESDYGGGPMEALAWVEALERAAWRAAGGQGAPYSRVCDFLQKEKPRGYGAVKPTYRPYCTPADLWAVLPDFVSAGVAEGVRAFGRQLKGFDEGDAVLTGVETRTSSPVRVVRDESMQSVSCRNLYPVGEGAGYAGGIVSAAVDGLRAAEAIIARFARP